MNRDGTNKVNVTNFGGLNLEFCWSPDGTRILFTRLIDSVYVVHSVKSDGTELTPLESTNVNSRYPSWSPNGAMITYSRLNNPGAPGVWEIVVKALMGDTSWVLSDSAESARFPFWSPNGQFVYYLLPGSGITAGVKVRSLDGRYVRMLPGFYPGQGRPVTWSADHSEFLAADDVSLAIVQADLSTFRRMPVSGFDPQWSFDRKWIVFLIRDDREVNQFVVARFDGTLARSLGDSRYGDLDPSFLPLDGEL